MSMNYYTNAGSEADLDSIFQPLTSLKDITSKTSGQTGPLSEIINIIIQERENYNKFEELLSNYTKQKINAIKRKEQKMRETISYIFYIFLCIFIFFYVYIC